MKEIFRFIRWSFTGLETWKRWFLFAMVCNFGSLAFPEPYNYWVNGVGIAIVLGYFAKWAIWDSIAANWRKYKEHRNELFTTIKTSDQR